ncbi:hypothetical protein PR048_013356 [Dryococelus australis]|uniref:Uncharacterized protein n=1 Tax=Dryococelus australis TaxID=614101 RepID=A0ABQ9HS39_9NEOP|nr:hypothetical protein PR048_013356 [Dryococelus australis]
MIFRLGIGLNTDIQNVSWTTNYYLRKNVSMARVYTDGGSYWELNEITRIMPKSLDPRRTHETSYEQEDKLYKFALANAKNEATSTRAICSPILKSKNSSPDVTSYDIRSDVVCRTMASPIVEGELTTVPCSPKPSYLRIQGGEVRGLIQDENDKFALSQYHRQLREGNGGRKGVVTEGRQGRGTSRPRSAFISHQLNIQEYDRRQTTIAMYSNAVKVPYVLAARREHTTPVLSLCLVATVYVMCVEVSPSSLSRFSPSNAENSSGARGSVVARLLASYLGEPGSIPGGVAPGFTLAGNVPAGFIGISRFPRTCIPTLLHVHLTSPSGGVVACHVRDVYALITRDGCRKNEASCGWSNWRGEPIVRRLGPPTSIKLRATPNFIHCSNPPVSLYDQNF